MRGWTLPVPGEPCIDYGYPAHAGMDHGLRVWDETEGGYPAHAGMDLSGLTFPAQRLRLPRPCGDGPVRAIGAGRDGKVTPPMRGWTHCRLRSRRRNAGYPAHAGMDPVYPNCLLRPTGLPRPCGDGPTQAHRDNAAAMVTPPMRGWTPSVASPTRLQTGYPAHAGMDPTAGFADEGYKRLPRPCGDGPQAGGSLSSHRRVTPPMRGWTSCPYRQSATGRGYPAHAGMDPMQKP